ncbi:MAG: pyruvate, water dikinase regulatory protein [Candidatus Celaenobacter polaris]|nr:pyruvate, water dikinase regulatory protein [Candidatus Celaenobacter polaris]
MISTKNSKSKKIRHIFIVSDATGSTCEMVVKAALSQFRTTDVHLHRVRYVRTEKEISNVVQEVMEVDGIIAYTLVSNELRDLIFDEGRKCAVPTIDVMGPLLSRFTEYLDISPMAIPGMFRSLDKNYYQRIECIDFAVKHDDGKKTGDLYKADIIIVGPSRTSKTPISIYLAYRDYKVVNIPMIVGIDPAEELFQIDQNKIVGLTISPSRLKIIREVRASRYTHIQLSEYIDLELIRRELKECMQIYNKHNWKIVDVTSKSIEEAATEIMRLFGNRKFDSTHVKKLSDHDG